MNKNSVNKLKQHLCINIGCTNKGHDSYPKCRNCYCKFKGWTGRRDWIDFSKYQFRK